MRIVAELQSFILKVISQDIIDYITGDAEELVIHANGQEFIACYNDCFENRPEVSVNFVISLKNQPTTRITDLSKFKPAEHDIHILDVSI